MLHDEPTCLKVWLHNLIEYAQPNDIVIILVATVNDVTLESQRQIFIDIVLVFRIDEPLDVIQVFLRVEFGRYNFE